MGIVARAFVLAEASSFVVPAFEEMVLELQNIGRRENRCLVLAALADELGTRQNQHASICG